MSARVEWTPSSEALLTRLMRYGFSLDEAAVVLEVTPTAVSSKSFKMRLREKVTLSQREAVARLFDSGVAAGRIVSKTGLSPVSVERVLLETARIPALPMDPEIEALREKARASEAAPVHVIERSEKFMSVIAEGLATGKTRKAMAEELGVAESMVQRSIRQRGLDVSKDVGKGILNGRRGELQSFVDEGLSDIQIARRMGVDTLTVTSAIERLVVRKSRQGVAA